MYIFVQHFNESHLLVWNLEAPTDFQICYVLFIYGCMQLLYLERFRYHIYLVIYASGDFAPVAGLMPSIYV